MEDLYTAYVLNENGEAEATGYAYGEPWVAQALAMDDIKFATPEEAREWWERWKANEQQEQAQAAEGQRH